MGAAARAGRVLPSLLVPLAAGAALLLGCQTPMPDPSEQTEPRPSISRRPATPSVNGTFRQRWATTGPTWSVSRPAAHPDELERNLWAEYEIAFMHHKLDDDQTAVELLGLLVAKIRRRRR